ncbi:mitochondrial amidoxime-reducing component 1-like [Gigantopelta aegis]|uniref:mitochondrial amidoxime-reducing component 1-like n=1 Tax=Gigantopelta aegis TaxID=1735272 RepID=UPI001B88856E|nr:mitochondrial amidoxime-reducing component 1-like [Gigantopelta aegis]
MPTESVVTPGVILGTLVLGTIIKFIVTSILSRRRNGFHLVGTVTRLSVFPIKSCAGFAVDNGVCTEIGLLVHGITDRHWVVTDAKFNVLSQQQAPKLAIVKVECQGYELVINATGMPTLKLPTDCPVDQSKIVICNTGKNTLEGLDCGDEAGAWFSAYLHREGLRVLHSAPGLRKKRHIHRTPDAAFSDFCAYHVLPESSFARLDERLDEPTTIECFRPTITDEWSEIRFGETTKLRCLYPTPRCTKVTVDQVTGVKNQSGEPLTTLRSFRCFPPYGQSPLLGVSAAIHTPGRINVGDPVYVKRK